MREAEENAGALSLKAGRLCLDFANTAEWHASDQPHEYLTSYSDLVLWSQHASILTDHQAQLLRRKATQRPAEAAKVLERAVALREATFRVFSAVTHGHPSETADLALLNEALAEALARSRIVPTASGFAWDWNDNQDPLDQMLWPVVRSAADLLTSQELDRVGECADDRGCGWLFMDMSRNHSRLWCDMRDCGNRAKARRHYERKRAGTGQAPKMQAS
jgi:predicted RNA-binding Zn ribbon-like protein